MDIKDRLPSSNPTLAKVSDVSVQDADQPANRAVSDTSMLTEVSDVSVLNPDQFTTKVKQAQKVKCKSLEKTNKTPSPLLSISVLPKIRNISAPDSPSISSESAANTDIVWVKYERLDPKSRPLAYLKLREVDSDDDPFVGEAGKPLSKKECEKKFEKWIDGVRDGDREEDRHEEGEHAISDTLMEGNE